MSEQTIITRPDGEQTAKPVSCSVRVYAFCVPLSGEFMVYSTPYGSHLPPLMERVARRKMPTDSGGFLLILATLVDLKVVIVRIQDFY